VCNYFRVSYTIKFNYRNEFLTFICLRWSYISYDLGISRTASREPHRIRDVTPGILTARYVYRVSRERGSMLLELLAFIRVTYAHVWVRVMEGVGKTMI
jgi:hypothetical protein